TNSIFTAWTYNSPYTTAALVFDSSAVSNPSQNQLFSVAELAGSVTTPLAAYTLDVSEGFYHQIFVGSRGATPQNTFTFANPTTLIFAVPDSQLGDNAGGVSVLIAAVAPPLSFPATSFPAGNIGFGYGPYQLTATGGYGTYVWSG